MKLNPHEYAIAKLSHLVICDILKVHKGEALKRAFRWCRKEGYVVRGHGAHLGAAYMYCNHLLQGSQKYYPVKNY